MALGALAACGPKHPFIWADELPASFDAGARLVQPGDQLSVVVQNREELSGDFPVGSDGSYVQPMLGHVQAAGKTPDVVAKAVAARLSAAYENPRVTITVSVLRPTTISILGEVNQPGRFELQADDGLLGALALAGGLTEFAKNDRIYVLRASPRTARIRFRYQDLTGGQTRATSFRLRHGDVIVVE